MAFAMLVVVVILVVVYLAKTCRLGKLSYKSCHDKGNFCGGVCESDPDPAAGSEALGLHELGVRMKPEGFCGTCSTTPAPSALAEKQGLMQMGWRQENLRTRPTCAPSHPAAVSEAQALQQVRALAPGSPYYTKSHFTSCRTNESCEAKGESHLLDELQALPAGFGDPMGGGIEPEALDSFASQKLHRDASAYSSSKARSENLRSNPHQISARRARFVSVSEGFGGPDATGYGWTPNAVDKAASPATGGWGDAQSTAHASCSRDCMDGCVGTNCEDICNEKCNDTALLAAVDE
jgi:hypothetical protein